MTTSIDSARPVTATETDPYGRVLDNLDANFGAAPRRRAAHAKGVVATGFFSPAAGASSVSRAGHLAHPRTPVVARFSSFPGGADHPDTAPEANPRGLAVQFRVGNAATTDLLAHSINGFPGRTIEDFADFLAAIAPQGPGPEAYLGTHPAAMAFVQAIQVHGTPSSFATLHYWPVNAFCFQDADGVERVGRYEWVPVAGLKLLDDDQVANQGPDFLAKELAVRLASGAVSFVLELQIAESGDVTDDANAAWPAERRRVELGTMHLTHLVPDSVYAEQGLFFDPVRLLDGITLSDDPLLVGRTRTYPLSLARRHTDG